MEWMVINGGMADDSFVTRCFPNKIVGPGRFDRKVVTAQKARNAVKASYVALGLPPGFRLEGKHWHHVGGGTGRGPWWLACTVGRRPVWFGFGTVI